MTKETTAAAIDLGAFVAQDTGSFELTSPTDDTKGTGWFIELAGPNHPITVAQAKTRANQALQRSARIEQQQLNGKKVKADEREADDVRRENVEFVTSRIVGWNPVIVPFIDPNEPTPYSAENAIKVFGDRRLAWAYAQVAQKLADDATFMPRSAKP